MATIVKPISPSELEIPENLVGTINAALKKSYLPPIGFCEFNWEPLIGRPYSPQVFVWLADLYERAGWKVTYLAGGIDGTDGIRFERERLK